MLLAESLRDVLTMMASALINDASMIPSAVDVVEVGGDLGLDIKSTDSDTNSRASSERSSKVDVSSPPMDRKTAGDRYSVNFILS